MSAPLLALENVTKHFVLRRSLVGTPTAVVRAVEALRGRIWCESQPGQGARFIVEFPAASG